MSKVLAAIFLFVVIAGMGVYLFSNQKQTISNDPKPVAPSSPSPSLPMSENEMDEVWAGGSSYLDTKGVFSLLYPNDWRQDTENNGERMRLTKIGATQQGQTELYDGVIVMFESVNLNGKSLSSWVDEQLKNATADGTTQITQPKKPTTFNAYPGFTYEVRGLGEFKNLVIQKDTASNNATVITYMVADPQNIGYQKEVDTILTSVKLLK